MPPSSGSAIGTYMLTYTASHTTRMLLHTWLRNCATHRKVAGSIPDGVIGIFHSGRTMALQLNSSPKTNEYQEYFLGVKAAGVYGWQPYHLHVPIVLKSGSLSLLEPSGPVQACNGIAVPLALYPHTLTIIVHKHVHGTGKLRWLRNYCGPIKNMLWESLEGNCALVFNSEGNESGQKRERLSQGQRKDVRATEYDELSE
jgi:hypothetical protein